MGGDAVRKSSTVTEPDFMMLSEVLHCLRVLGPCDHSHQQHKEDVCQRMPYSTRLARVLEAPTAR